MIWFTSDTHFGHRKLVVGGGGDSDRPSRPFPDVPTMNAALIENWNRVVKPGDKVFHLGDVSFAPPSVTRQIIPTLNGYKVLIKGNHDKGKGEKSWKGMGFDEVYNNYLFAADYNGGTFIGLIHNPSEVDLLLARPEIILCGHVHERWKFLFSPRRLIINVGVDVWNFTPVSIDQILAIPEVTRL